MYTCLFRTQKLVPENFGLHWFHGTTNKGKLNHKAIIRKSDFKMVNK